MRRNDRDKDKELDEVDAQGKAKNPPKEQPKKAAEKPKGSFFTPVSDMPDDLDYKSPEQKAQDKARRKVREELMSTKEKLKPETVEGTVKTNQFTHEKTVTVKRMTGVKQEDETPKRTPKK